MKQFVRMYRAEWYKMRHTMIPALHVLVPLAGSAAFLLYYWMRPMEGIVQLAGFAEIMGLVFPFLVSLLVTRSVGLEESNHYQVFLGGNAGRLSSLLAKCMVMQTAGLGAVSLGIASFAAGEMILLGNRDISGRIYLSVVIALWLGSLLMYPIHFFLCMRFSKSVSIAIGTAQSVLAGLLITVLGEGVWQFAPSSWSIRLTSYVFVETEFSGNICLLISLVICVIIFLWFSLRGDYVAAESGE